MREKIRLASPKKKFLAAVLLLLLALGVGWMNLDFPGTREFACRRTEAESLWSPGVTVAYGDSGDREFQHWVLRRVEGMWYLQYLDRWFFLWRPSDLYGYGITADQALGGCLPEQPFWLYAYFLSEPVTVLAVAPAPSIVRVEATLWAEPSEEFKDTRLRPTTPVTVELTPTGTDDRAFLGTMSYNREEIDAQAEQYWADHSVALSPHDYKVRLVLRGYDADGRLAATYDYPPTS